MQGNRSDVSSVGSKICHSRAVTLLALALIVFFVFNVAIYSRSLRIPALLGSLSILIECIPDKPNYYCPYTKNQRWLTSNNTTFAMSLLIVSNYSTNNINASTSVGLTATDLIWSQIGYNSFKTTQMHTSRNWNDTNSNKNKKKQKKEKCTNIIRMHVLVAHHKTGSKTFAKIARIIRLHYHMQNEEYKCRNRFYYFWADHWRDYFITSTMQKLGQTMAELNSNNDNQNHEKPKYELYFIHFMRNPVSTVISGFYYHSQKLRPESWLDKKIENTCLYHNATRKNAVESYAREIVFGDKIGTNIIDQHIDLSINEFFKKMKNISLPLAIFIQFQFDYCLLWNEFLKAFNVKNTKLLSDNVKIVNESYNIKFEYFWKFTDLTQYKKLKLDAKFNLSDYTRNVGKIDTIANNIESMYNFDRSMLKLLQITLPNLDINAYGRILSETVQYDIYRWEKNEMDRNKHIMTNSYDRMQAIDALLMNKQTCSELKRISESIDYFWLYPHYC